MKKHFATLLMGFILIHAHVCGYVIELNGSYDYFRGMPDGSWNGNSGGVLSANICTPIFNRFGFQLGGSYGFYNWDGRQNLSFTNPNVILQEDFITVGLVTRAGPLRAGVVYDRLFSDHFGIYDLTPSIDQMRLQAGYNFCREEVGVWGTAHLTTVHRFSLGLPVSFRAIDQMNVFWTHRFRNCAKTTIWAGVPYTFSLMYPRQNAGAYIVGFAIRAPLLKNLYFDGHGSYMGSRTTACGCLRTTNYNANLCLGITYLMGDRRSYGNLTYLPLANNSNFMIDTNFNQ